MSARTASMPVGNDSQTTGHYVYVHVCVVHTIIHPCNCCTCMPFTHVHTYLVMTILALLLLLLPFAFPFPSLFPSPSHSILPSDPSNSHVLHPSLQSLEYIVTCMRCAVHDTAHPLVLTCIHVHTFLCSYQCLFPSLPPSLHYSLSHFSSTSPFLFPSLPTHAPSSPSPFFAPFLPLFPCSLFLI